MIAEDSINPVTSLPTLDGDIKAKVASDPSLLQVLLDGKVRSLYYVANCCVKTQRRSWHFDGLRQGQIIAESKGQQHFS